jgi:hypothetical protein
MWCVVPLQSLAVEKIVGFWLGVAVLSSYEYEGQVIVCPCNSWHACELWSERTTSQCVLIVSGSRNGLA